MARRPAILGALILALIVSVAVARNYTSLWSPASPPPVIEPQADRRATSAVAEKSTARIPSPAAEPTPEASNVKPAARQPTFDIVRIDPNGTSVFAGQSEPDAEIAILAGGKEVARARAGSDGAWSVVTNGAYTGGNLPFRVSASKDGRTAISDAVTVAVPVTPVETPPRVAVRPRIAAATAPAAAPPDKSAHAAPPAKAEMPTAKRELERLVEEVRTNPEVANNPARAPAVIPVPITFQTGRATFTPDGRHAASLLAEYVKGAGLSVITLSGHADERGPDRYNLRLSRQRLEAIATYLREHGYTGELTLLAKGEREPFAGIDRKATPRTVLWSYDRRVELRTR